MELRGVFCGGKFSSAAPRQRQWCSGSRNRGSVRTVDTLVVGSGFREEVVTAAKKSPAAVATAAEGIRAVVSETMTVAMATADNSGNGGTGKGGGNRGSSRQTTSNQNAAAVEQWRLDRVMLVAGVVVAAVAAAVVAAVKLHEQIVVWPPWLEVMPPNSSERGSTRTVIDEYT